MKFTTHTRPQGSALLLALLTAFVEQQRMRLPGTKYVPCYKVIK